MAVTVITFCDRCGKTPIDDDYKLTVHVRDELPRHGGFVTGHETDKQFVFCNECDRQIKKDLLAFFKFKGRIRSAGHVRNKQISRSGERKEERK